MVVENFSEYFWPAFISIMLMHFFYSAFKMKWPELYFSDADSLSFFISVNPKRYILFRIAPVFIITTMVLSAYSKQFAAHELLFLGLSVGIVHSLSTNGRALIKLIYNSKSIAKFVNRVTQQLFHIFSIVVLSLTGLFGGVISKSHLISKVTPTIEGIINNIWASVITALVAVYLYKSFESQRMSDDEMLYRSLNSIPIELLKFIEVHCESRNADPNLVKAVCLVENIQRPLWFRKLEEMKSRIVHHGSYGIMQVESDKILSDKESISLAIDNFFVNSAGLSIYHEDVEDGIIAMLRKYNNNEKYIQLVFKAYSFIAPNPLDNYAVLH